ncbi:copia protein, partial [Peziza echinospora]
SAMLWEANLPIDFWWEAVATATYLRNRSPTSSLPGNITPYQAYFGSPPNLGHLRIFGCRVQALVPDHMRSKFDSHTSECIFLGYTDTE